GEIAALCELARPSVAVVTQCSPAHLKGFGSLEGVARAKGEIFTLLGPGGTAVINADDPYAGLWRTLAGGCQKLSFGFAASPDVTATVIDSTSVLDGTKLRLHTPAGSIDIHIQLLGRHNISNALAAAASALALGIGLGDIAAGLQSMRAVQGRLQPRAGRSGTRLFDDSYNANPGSLKAALEFLASCPGEQWLVLGDMGELGPEAAGYHHQAGVLARRLGIQRLYATGDLARASVDGFGPGGRFFTTVDTLVECLGGDLHPQVTVLVKGSRSMRMERVVSFLQHEGA
ncbi:MAG: UDP-N-acetylmuramoyl-tripeptide--D-alanyl-D-alanine ligase, partial [Anaerolineales bacterium]